MVTAPTLPFVNVAPTPSVPLLYVYPKLAVVAHLHSSSGELADEIEFHCNVPVLSDNIKY